MTEPGRATRSDPTVSAAVMRTLRQCVPPRLAAAVARYRALPVSVAEWNQQYGSGGWNNLESVRELPRYSVIAGYCRFYRPNGRVLDVGCGNGILASHLGARGVSSYVGFDLSETAITQARSRAVTNAAFVVADVELFVPPHAFDVVVFNEVLYYLHAPVAAVERLAGALGSGGLIIVSLFRTRRGLQIGAMLNRAFVAIDRTSIRHASRLTWDIIVFAPLRDTMHGSPRDA